MEEITRTVRDLPFAERLAFESAVGHALDDNQQIVLRVLDHAEETVRSMPPTGGTTPVSATLPDWCRVYEGLTDEEIAEVEKIALQRADLTRNAG